MSAIFTVLFAGNATVLARKNHSGEIFRAGYMSCELDCRMQDTSNLLLKMFSCCRIDPLLKLLLLQQFQQFFVAVIIFIACMSQRACFELVEMVLKILQRYKSLLSFLKRNNPFQNISNRFRLLFCRLIFQYIILLSCAYYL